jgi:cysteine desulfurase
MGKLELANQPWGGCAGITFSGHKFGGPKGTGCLILGPEWRGLKVQAGGAQELDSRAGTENVAGVAAMVAALEHRVSHPASNDALHGEIKIHGKEAERVWNTCSLSLPDHRSSRWIAHLDKLGFQVSSGSACSTGKEGPSAVLAAMGVDPEMGHRTLRISSGWETTPEDWDHLYEAICATREKLDQSGGSAGPGKVIEI